MGMHPGRTPTRIVDVLEAYGSGMLTTEITMEMQERWPETTLEAVKRALHRMRHRGVLERHRTTYYDGRHCHIESLWRLTDDYPPEL